MRKVILSDSLNFGSFPGFVSFHCGKSYAEIEKVLSRKKHKGWKDAFTYCKPLFDDGLAWGFTSKQEIDGRFYFFLVIHEPFVFDDFSMCALAHEIVHLCQFHLTDLLDRNIECEAEAYTHTHLMSQALEKLRKKKNEINPK